MMTEEEQRQEDRADLKEARLSEAEFQHRFATLYGWLMAGVALALAAILTILIVLLVSLAGSGADARRASDCVISLGQNGPGGARQPELVIACYELNGAEPPVLPEVEEP